MRVAGPVVRKPPALAHRLPVKLRARVCHGRVEIRVLAVYLHGQVQRLLHCLAVVVGESEYEVRYYAHVHVVGHVDSVPYLLLPLAHAIPYEFAPALEPVGHPVDAGALHLFKQSGVHGVRPRVCPEVHAVVALYQEVAYPVDSLFVYRKGVVHNLGVLYAVFAYEQVYLLDEVFRTAGPEAAPAVYSVYRAIRTVERASHARKHHGIRFPAFVAEAVPVVSPVFVHGQHVPRHERQLVEILNKRRGPVLHYLPVLLITNSLHIDLVCLGVLPQDLKKVRRGEIAL